MTARTAVARTTLATVVAFAGIGPAAGAAGFGPVRSLSPAMGMVDSPTAAIAPTGETAVPLPTRPRMPCG